MLTVRFFDGPELKTGESMAALGVALGGMATGLMGVGIGLSIIPTGFTQGLGSAIFLLGIASMFTAFTVMSLGAGIMLGSALFGQMGSMLFGSSKSEDATAAPALM